MTEESVLFRVTRPRTTVFHPDRSVSTSPVQTGGEMQLPRSVAEYHAKNGVGEIVEDTPAETPEGETPEGETPEGETPEGGEQAVPKRRGRPAAASSA